MRGELLVLDSINYYNKNQKKSKLLGILESSYKNWLFLKIDSKNTMKDSSTP